MSLRRKRWKPNLPQGQAGAPGSLTYTHQNAEAPSATDCDSPRASISSSTHDAGLPSTAQRLEAEVVTVSMAELVGELVLRVRPQLASFEIDELAYLKLCLELVERDMPQTWLRLRRVQQFQSAVERRIQTTMTRD